jgi:hypothetical protein
MKLSDLSHTDIIGSTIGLIGIVLAAVFYFRGKEQSFPCYSVINAPLIGRRGVNFPEKLKIEYDGAPVPSLSIAVIYFWNRGRKTLDKSDLVSADPIVLHFAEERAPVRVLEVRSILMTRDVLGVSASPMGDAIALNFEFLDRADGFALVVLHAGGERTRVTCSGTIKGVPQGARRASVVDTEPSRNYHPVTRGALQVTGAALCGFLGFIGLRIGNSAAMSEIESSEHPKLAKPSAPGFPVNFFAHVDPVYGMFAGVLLFVLFVLFIALMENRNIPAALRPKVK